MKKVIIAIASLILCISLAACSNSGTADTKEINPDNMKVSASYTYDEALDKLGDSESEKIVKEYIGFLTDPSYSTSNDENISAVGYANTKTFVNSEFDYKPSLFASLRNVASSIIDCNKKYIWLGYNGDGGVDCVNVDDGTTVSFTKDELTSGSILLLVGNNNTSLVYVITEDGVTVISEE